MKSIILSLVLTLSLFAKERIVTLSPAINEIVYALGAGDKVVANTDYCRYPKASLLVPKVGGYFSVSLEKIVASKPTIVMMQKNNKKLATKLEKLGIKTEIVQTDSLVHIKEAIVNIGTLLHREEKAKRIVKNINQALANLKGIGTNKRILIVIGHNTSLVKRIFVAVRTSTLKRSSKPVAIPTLFTVSKKGNPFLIWKISSQPILISLSSWHHLKRSMELKIVTSYHHGEDCLSMQQRQTPSTL